MTKAHCSWWNHSGPIVKNPKVDSRTNLLTTVYARITVAEKVLFDGVSWRELFPVR
jgi:hypothetical protein